MGTIVGIIVILFLIRRCRRLGCRLSCCSQCFRSIRQGCANCCRCPSQERPHSPEAYIEPPPIPNVIRRDSAAVELTELHHPVTVEELRRLECAICMEIGIDIMTQCEHYFHWKCLQEWLRRKSDCPYCRNHLSRKYYQACTRCEQFFLPARITGIVSGGLVCICCRAKPNALNETNEHFGEPRPDYNK